MYTVEEYLKQVMEITPEDDTQLYWFCHGYFTSRFVHDSKVQGGLKYMTKIHNELIEMEKAAVKLKETGS